MLKTLLPKFALFLMKVRIVELPLKCLKIINTNLTNLKYTNTSTKDTSILRAFAVISSKNKEFHSSFLGTPS